MKGSALIWIIGFLVVGIIAVIYLQQKSKQTAMEQKNAAALAEAAIATQYLNYINNQNQIQASGQTSASDWMTLIGSVVGATGDIWGSIGGGSGN